MVLDAWGASTEELPTSNKEESDWLATLGGFRLLIEEKTKLEDPERTAERTEALKTNEVFGTIVPLSRNNRLSGIIKKASSQLTSSGTTRDHNARIVWLTAVGFDGEAKYHQTFSTLYGTTKVFEIGKSLMRDCYFFHRSDFFRFRSHLDGAVIAFLSGEMVTMKLCLNPYGERWQDLRDSPFASRFPAGPIDPIAAEASGTAFIADTDIDRKDSNAVLAFLQNKYRLERLMNIDMNMATAVEAVPLE